MYLHVNYLSLLEIFICFVYYAHTVCYMYTLQLTAFYWIEEFHGAPLTSPVCFVKSFRYCMN